MFLFVATTLLYVVAMTTGDVDLPLRHRNILYHRKPGLCKEGCQITKSPTCFGYEPNCTDRYEPSWPHSCENTYKFWKQADFGYLEDRLKEKQDLQICKSSEPNGSSLNCTSKIQSCLGEHVYVDLRNPGSRGRIYAFHVFKRGEIGGKCEVDAGKLAAQESPQLDGWLRSWFPEITNFTSLPDFVYNGSRCDVTIDKPIVIMKLDQGTNMYHRFCDLINLYITLHMNGSIEFNKDLIIAKWDLTYRNHRDYFHESWDAFTSHPLKDVRDWIGKRVCFRHVIFSFLPRMISGIFYNLRLEPGCQGSGLVKSFSEFFLHRLKITQEATKPSKIRVTFMTRREYPDSGPMWRRVINQDQLIRVLSEFDDFEVRVEEFRHEEMTLKEQLEVTHNTDLLIGIHGAGLTQILFLPDWAVVFELYDCGAICYRDLARIRGVRHMTWHNHENMTRHDCDEENKLNPRFWNYSFDPKEFRRLILQARTMLFENKIFSRRFAAAGHQEL